MCLQTYPINSNTYHTYDDPEDYEERIASWDNKSDSNTSDIHKFVPTHKANSDGTVFKLTNISNQIDNINSIYEIGSILFKDGRSKSPEEKAALKLYYKDKYKRIKID